jgi:glycosyltransferase involved in cell wall biosynthesis
MSTVPLTVLMAFHNDAPFIARAIESILGQTYDDFEFVIVNDASTDGSRDVVAGYADPRIRLIDNPQNLRLARSLNRGLEAARGELIARLDANDVATPNRLETQMRFMRENGDFALTGGQYEVIDTRGRRVPLAAFRKPVTELGVQWYFLFDSPFVHSTVMFRKSAANEAGRYDPTFDFAPSEDVVLWGRMAERHRMVNLPDVFVSQRYDPRSITYDPTRPDRRGFAPRLAGHFAGNMKRYLGNDHADEWAGLVTTFVAEDLPVTDAMFAQYIDAVNAMERRLIEVHPDAAGNPDVRRGKAQLLARALFRLARRSRVESLGLFLRILRGHPPTALRQLPKYAAAGLLGSRAWDLWRWWRRA